MLNNRTNMMVDVEICSKIEIRRDFGNKKNVYFHFMLLTLYDVTDNADWIHGSASLGDKLILKRFSMNCQYFARMMSCVEIN